MDMDIAFIMAALRLGPDGSKRKRGEAPSGVELVQWAHDGKWPELNAYLKACSAASLVMEEIAERDGTLPHKASAVESMKHWFSSWLVAWNAAAGSGLHPRMWFRLQIQSMPREKMPLPSSFSSEEAKRRIGDSILASSEYYGMRGASAALLKSGPSLRALFDAALFPKHPSILSLPARRALFKERADGLVLAADPGVFALSGKLPPLMNARLRLAMERLEQDDALFEEWSSEADRYRTLMAGGPHDG